MQEMTSFTDTRLHVVVRPTLEYLLPQAYASVCSVLVGDYDVSHGYAALDTLAELAVAPAPLGRESEVEAEVEAELERLSAATCTHVAEYLAALHGEWRIYADGIARGARLSVKRITEDANRADAVWRMYRDRNTAVVDREHRAELQRLHQELHAARTSLRERALPTTQRSDELVSACERLKHAFSSAYQKTATANLLARKRAFEHSLRALQAPVAEEAMTHLRRLLAHA